MIRRAVRGARALLDSRYDAPPALPADRLGQPLDDGEMITMYSRSKINLGFSSVGNTHRGENRIVQIRLRDFEVPMSGGFYMVEHMEELAEFYEIEKEVVCYSSMDDLADKIKYYLAHDSERERIRIAGYERARRDHTWHRRFQSVFSTIGLDAGG
jgi:spore maturation protein CgeB